MTSVEAQVKAQFSRRFEKADAVLFQGMAEFYFQSAVFLKKKDVKIADSLRLLARNCQKRLFIGIGAELLLKAIYLRHGYSINKLAPGQPNPPKFPFTFDQLRGFHQQVDSTFMLNDLIQSLGNVVDLSHAPAAMRGLKIAKVFRNKEGHGVVAQHRFDASNYRDIENALVELYGTVLKTRLVVRFALEPRDQPMWKVTV